MFTNKSKKKAEALVRGIITMLVPAALIIASIIFLGQTGSVESYNKDNELMYNIIKYSLYILDVIAGIIILRTIVGLLYDLEILKKKQHKANIKED